MKIVMLGHSGVGKTSYVSSMYAQMQGGAGGFRIVADADDDEALRAAAGDIRRGRYPYASGQREGFQFTLRYGGADVLPFTWWDYRGAALTERLRDSPYARDLHADLATASGILLFHDCRQLLTGSAASRQVAVLTGLLHRALDARGQRLTPVAIVLTKADLVDFTEPEVRARLRRPFQPVIDAVSRTLHVQGSLMLVSCGPHPVGVRLPALWMLQHGILNRAMELAGSVPTTADAAPVAGEAARIRPLVEPAERLGALLARVDRF